MKKVKDFLLMVLATLIALPFLVIGFVRWLVLPSPDDCKCCPKAGENCGDCKSHPTNCSIWQFGFRLSANTNTFENNLKKSVILIDLGGR